MKAVWLALAAGVIGCAGCASTPKREMRPPSTEEFYTPPANMYNTPPDLPRDQPLLVPKSNMPSMNSNPGMGGMPSPQMGPGAAPGGVRR
jgi:hypothetical protein